MQIYIGPTKSFEKIKQEPICYGLFMKETLFSCPCCNTLSVSPSQNSTHLCMRPHELSLGSQNTKNCLLKASIEVSDDLRTELNKTKRPSEFSLPMCFSFVVCTALNMTERIQTSQYKVYAFLPLITSLVKYSVYKVTSCCVMYWR